MACVSLSALGPPPVYGVMLFAASLAVTLYKDIARDLYAYAHVPCMRSKIKNKLLLSVECVIHLSLYIYTERDRERDRYLFLSLYICIIVLPYGGGLSAVRLSIPWCWHHFGPFFLSDPYRWLLSRSQSSTRTRRKEGAKAPGVTGRQRCAGSSGSI